MNHKHSLVPRPILSVACILKLSSQYCALKSGLGDEASIYIVCVYLQSLSNLTSLPASSLNGILPGLLKSRLLQVLLKCGWHNLNR